MELPLAEAVEREHIGDVSERYVQVSYEIADERERKPAATTTLKYLPECE
jgi:hypothetical protein